MASAIKNTPILKDRDSERFNKILAEQSSKKVTIPNSAEMRAFVNKVMTSQK